MDAIGYEYLRTQLGLLVFPVDHPASIRPVSRILDVQDELQVPKGVAPKSGHPIEHLLFALRYEGINLQILAETMPKIAGEDLIARLRESPSGLFIRKACYLWEWFANGELSNLPAIAGPYGDLFDPADYVTGIVRKDAKWRINFNGLGSAEYCPVVRLTQLVKDGIASDVLGRTKAFLESLGPTNADRTLSWAYLSETDSSFAIEREAPSQSKAETFVALL